MKPSVETRVTPDLVAYLDGELSEQDHRRVAAAVEDSVRLQEEAARFARLGSVVAGLERVAPSADFVATFRRRLERERRIAHESQFARWRRTWSEKRAMLTGPRRRAHRSLSWQGRLRAGESRAPGRGRWTPVLVPVASLLIILATLFSGRLSSLPSPQPTRSERIPAQVMENATFFRDYWLTARLERWTHFDDIMQTRVPRRSGSPTREQLPSPLIENPGFFMHYQILRRMEQFQHFESVQSLPFDRADRRQG